MILKTTIVVCEIKKLLCNECIFLMTISFAGSSICSKIKLKFAGTRFSRQIQVSRTWLSCMLAPWLQLCLTSPKVIWSFDLSAWTTLVRSECANSETIPMKIYWVIYVYVYSKFQARAYSSTPGQISKFLFNPSFSLSVSLWISRYFSCTSLPFYSLSVFSVIFFPPFFLSESLLCGENSI